MCSFGVFCFTADYLISSALSVSGIYNKWMKMQLLCVRNIQAPFNRIQWVKVTNNQEDKQRNEWVVKSRSLLLGEAWTQNNGFCLVCFGGANKALSPPIGKREEEFIRSLTEAQQVVSWTSSRMVQQAAKSRPTEQERDKEGIWVLQQDLEAPKVHDQLPLTLQYTAIKTFPPSPVGGSLQSMQPELPLPSDLV